MKLEAYTDGSNTYNGFDYSYGGYGWVLILDDKEIIKGGKSMPVNLKQPVTNNRAELLAIIDVLEFIGTNELFIADKIDVFSDSQLCVKCTTGEWKPKKNFDLFAKFFKAKKVLTDNRMEVNINWIKGHAGHMYNEMADQLAGAYAEMVRQPKPRTTEKVNIL